MSTVLKFNVEILGACGMQAPPNVAADLKDFTDQLLNALQTPQYNADNAAECFKFCIATLPFRRALNLAGWIDPAVKIEIKRRTVEHIKQAKQKLLMGLCCYVSDSMYPVIEKDPVYVRDLAAVFRMAVFNGAITDVHRTLKEFVDIQSDEVILLAVANFEHEHETINWMRGIHQLAITVLFKDCCAWYKKSWPAWEPDHTRDMLYIYDVTMYLDTQPITQPMVCERADTQHTVNIRWSPYAINDTLREAFKRYDFMHVEVPNLEYGPLPSFDTIQIAQQTFCRQKPGDTPQPRSVFACENMGGTQPVLPATLDATRDLPGSQGVPADPFAALLGKIAKCRVITTRNIEMSMPPLRDKFAALLDKLKC